MKNCILIQVVKFLWVSFKALLILQKSKIKF